MRDEGLSTSVSSKKGRLLPTFFRLSCSKELSYFPPLPPERLLLLLLLDDDLELELDRDEEALLLRLEELERALLEREEELLLEPL